MQSCDTFALTASRFYENKNLFAKDSDRPLGESQPLVYFPAATYETGRQLRCTHLTIPQVSSTYAVIGCQPYWIWGFEMGLNECGLVIGNEAQGSRCAPEKEEGLLGMDLIRLALERAANARDAITVITSLLEQYGQNANASMLFDRRYESSYILMDRNELWLLETAGRQWVAKQVNDYTAISNCYSIGTDYDLCSADMEKTVRENRWLAPDEPINFAKAYTLPASRQGHSTPRWRRLCQLIEAGQGPLTVENVKAILRDHFDGEIIQPRFGGCYGMFVSICMHAMTWDVAQTTASLIYRWHDQLGPVMLYAPSLPCCSVYLPVYWTGSLPEAISMGGSTYNPDALWWRAERLAMAISIDEDKFGPQARTALRQLEDRLALEAAEVEEKACRLLDSGDQDGAYACLNELTCSAVERLMALTQTLADEICAAVAKSGGLYGPRKEFLEDYCKRTNLPL